MAIYTRKEFSELCGMTPGNLSNYVKRGHVLPNADDMIDTSEMKNAYFFEKRRSMPPKPVKIIEPKVPEVVNSENPEVAEAIISEPVEELPPIKVHPQPVNINPKKLPTKKISDANTYVDSNYDPAVVRRFELENAQKDANLRKTLKEIAILELKEQKQRGEVIPTDIVMPIMAQHFKSVTTEFKQGAEQLLVILQAKHGFSRDQMAEYRGNLIKIINDSIKKAVAESEKSIENIVSEYSTKKGVGERE